jgi:hypothetical protein
MVVLNVKWVILKKRKIAILDFKNSLGSMSQNPPSYSGIQYDMTSFLVTVTQPVFTAASQSGLVEMGSFKFFLGWPLMCKRQNAISVQHRNKSSPTKWFHLQHVDYNNKNFLQEHTFGFQNFH